MRRPGRPLAVGWQLPLATDCCDATADIGDNIGDVVDAADAVSGDVHALGDACDDDDDAYAGAACADVAVAAAAAGTAALVAVAAAPAGAAAAAAPSALTVICSHRICKRDSRPAAIDAAAETSDSPHVLAVSASACVTSFGIRSRRCLCWMPSTSLRRPSAHCW